MFPRRSAVLRGLTFVSIVFVVLFLWLTGPEGGNPGFFGLFDPGPLNETELRIEFYHLKTLTNDSQLSLENKTVNQIYQYVQALKKELPVNPHNFKYVINPGSQICQKDIFLISYIHSAPGHYKRRAAIRESWGSPSNFHDLNFRLVFLVGKPKEHSIQEALMMESEIYGDIVQENFLDSYRNLTYKAIMGLKWVSQHCRHATFVLKSDDDIFVNIFNVVSHLRSIAMRPGGTKSLLLCLVWSRMKVVRDPKSKWYLSEAEFKESYFPTYCSGSAFMMSLDSAEAMYKASLQVPFFWVDDFYVTGLLAAKVGLVHKKFNSVYVLGPSTFLEKFSEPTKWRTLTFGHVHNLNHMGQVWHRVVQDRQIATEKPPHGDKTQEPTTKNPFRRFMS